MAQEISTQRVLAPTPQTREFADLLGRYANRIQTTSGGTSSISSALAPAGRDLERIESRRRELVAGLTRADPALIVPRIARLFLRFPNFKPENPAAVASAYAADLADFPLWAIEAGLMAMLKGHGLPNKEFAPSSPSVRDVVAREVTKAEAELAAIERVLRAKPKPPVTAPDPERKKALLQAVDDLIGGMRRSTEGPKRGGMTEAELDAAKSVNDAFAAGLPDPRPIAKLSPEIVAALQAKYRLSDSQSEDAA